MEDGPIALDVCGLCKQFGGLRAVDDCSFRALRGRVTGLIGPNGAGKSTAIDLISGFKLADAGSVVFEGTELRGRPPHDISRLGLIRTFQTPREWPALTVLENLLLARWDGGRETFWRAVRGLGRAGRAAATEELGRAREILAEFQLANLRNERAGNLSGGQKRLLEFARIRMAQPRMVILDEPMGGVNPVTVRENLEMGGFIKRSGVRERIEQLFELFPDLRAASRRQANTLSGGQRTMLA